MKLHELFDRLYCINLARRPDRRKEAEDEFRRHGLAVKFIPANDGARCEGSKLHEEMAGPRIACCLSHAGVLATMCRDSLARIIVFEDDVQFLESPHIDYIPADFDLFYFGGNSPTLIERVCGRTWRVANCLSGHAYGISRRFADYMRPILWNPVRPLDELYAEHSKQFNVYAVLPFVATQRVSYSDIEGGVADYRSVLEYHGPMAPSSHYTFF